MSKGLFKMLAASPLATNNGSPGGVRPMPRPAPGPQPPASAPRQGPLGAYLGPQGSDTRTDMALEMLKAAMASAPGSGSPILQLLAPLAGSMIGARAEKQRGDAKAAEVSAMTETVLGPNGMSPAAKRYLDVMNNENAPDYLRAIAKKQFEASIVPIDSATPRPSSGRSSGGGATAGTGTGTGAGGKPTRVYGAPFEINGVMYQRDGYGNAVPMRGPDGGPVPGKGGGATVPGGAAPADDPLGLRNPPVDNPLEMP